MGAPAFSFNGYLVHEYFIAGSHAIKIRTYQIKA